MPDVPVESFDPQPDPIRHSALSGAHGYVRTVNVPGDQTSFHLFEGSALDEVCGVLAHADLAYDRIVESCRITPSDDETIQGEGST